MNLIQLTSDAHKEYTKYCYECNAIAFISLQIGDSSINLCADCYCNLKGILK